MSEAAVSREEFFRKRRSKNIAVGLTVAGAMLLFFIITIVRMGTQ